MSHHPSLRAPPELAMTQLPASPIADDEDLQEEDVEATQDAHADEDDAHAGATTDTGAISDVDSECMDAEEFERYAAKIATTPTNAAARSGRSSAVSVSGGDAEEEPYELRLDASLDDDQEENGSVTHSPRRPDSPLQLVDDDIEINLPESDAEADDNDGEEEREQEQQEETSVNAEVNASAEAPQQDEGWISAFTQQPEEDAAPSMSTDSNDDAVIADEEEPTPIVLPIAVPEHAKPTATAVPSPAVLALARRHNTLVAGRSSSQLASTAASSSLPNASPASASSGATHVTMTSSYVPQRTPTTASSASSTSHSAKPAAPAASTSTPLISSSAAIPRRPLQQLVALPMPTPDDIEDFEDEPMEEGDQPDEIEDPDSPSFRHSNAAFSAASPSIVVSPSSRNAAPSPRAARLLPPHISPAASGSAPSTSSIDLTEDSPPPSPSRGRWADDYYNSKIVPMTMHTTKPTAAMRKVASKHASIFTSSSNSGSGGSAGELDSTVAASPAAISSTTAPSNKPFVSPFTAPRPPSSSMASSAFIAATSTPAAAASSSTFRTFSNSLNKAAAAAASASSSSMPPVPSSNIWSKIRQPAAAVPSDDALMGDDFQAMFASTSTPHTAAVLGPEMKRSSAQFKQRQPVDFSAAAGSSTVAASATHSQLKIRSRSDFYKDAIVPPSSSAAAAAASSSTSSRPNPSSDFYREALAAAEAADAADKVSALLNSSSSTTTKVAPISPSKRMKTIDGWFRPQSGDGGGAAASAASSSESRPPAAATNRKQFTKQDVANRKRKVDSVSPPSSSHSSRENSRAPSPINYDDLNDDPMDTDDSFSRALDRRVDHAQTASDMIPKERRHLPMWLPQAPFPSEKLRTGASTKQRRVGLPRPSSPSAAASAISSSKLKTSSKHASSDARKEIRRQMEAASKAHPHPRSKDSHRPSSPAYSMNPAAAPDLNEPDKHLLKVGSAIGALPPKAIVPTTKRTVSQMVAAGKALAAAAAGATGGTTGESRKGVVQLAAPALTAKQAQANRAKQEELRANKTKKQEAESKKQRLYPVLDDLHRRILLWSLREIGTTVATSIQSQLCKIPLRFKDVDEYQSIMFPLLIEECRAGIEAQLEELTAGQNAKQNGDTPVVLNSKSIDITPIGATLNVIKNEIVKGESRVIAELRLSATSSSSSSSSAASSSSRHNSRDRDNSGYASDDLVILYPQDTLFVESDLENTTWQSAEYAILGLLMEYQNKEEKKLAAEAMSKQKAPVAGAVNGGASSTHAVDAPPFKIKLYFNGTIVTPAKRAVLQGQQQWIMIKLSNLKTLHREYAALASVAQTNLADAIFTPKRAGDVDSEEMKESLSESSDESINPTAILAAVSKSTTPARMLSQFPSHICGRFNPAQLHAIATALIRSTGFTLIQGPPGTGKTSTIVGLVNMLWIQHQAKLYLRGHQSAYAPMTNDTSTPSSTAIAARRQLSSTAAEALKRSSSNSSKTRHFRILICAPSNAAIDEITDRLHDSLYDCHAKKMHLNIVRLGAGNRKNANQNQNGGKNNNADKSSMPFHERVSLDQLVRDRMAQREGTSGGIGSSATTTGTAGSSTATTTAAGSSSAAPPASSSNTISTRSLTPLEVLKARVRVVSASITELAAKSNDVHAKIAAAEQAQKEEELADERNALMRAAGQIPPPRTSPLIDYDKLLAKLHEEKRTVLKQKNAQLQTGNDLRQSIKREEMLSLSPREAEQADILINANIICTTLSGAGIEFFRDRELDFTTCIIDESAQSNELQTLIPLKYKVKRCILVGDPNQLSATVKSSEAIKYAYKQSLFERIQLNSPDEVELLNLQYRMHWEIVRWPSKMFYQGRLKTAVERCASLMNVRHLSSVGSSSSSSSSSSSTSKSSSSMDLRLAPYVFYDVAHGSERSGRGSSMSNSAEVDVAVSLFQFLRKAWSASDRGKEANVTTTTFIKQVGLISPYSQQVFELRRAFQKILTPHEMLHLDIDSVDSFQGREKEFIIFSVVRAGSGIGFVRELSRLNVALTRAKQSLFVLGHASTLEADTTWCDMLKDAHERKRIISVPKNVRALFDRSIGTEKQYLRDMETCPYDMSEIERAMVKMGLKEGSLAKGELESSKVKSKEDSSKAAAASTPAKKLVPSSTATPTTSKLSSTQATSAAAGTITSPAAGKPRSLAKTPAVGTSSNTTISPTAKVPAKPIAPAGPAVIDTSVPVISNVIKKMTPKATASPFLETSRPNAIKTPLVPIELAMQKMAGKPVPTAMTMTALKPTMKVGGTGSSSAAGPSSTTTMAEKIAAVKQMQQQKQQATAGARTTASAAVAPSSDANAKVAATSLTSASATAAATLGTKLVNPSSSTPATTKPTTSSTPSTTKPVTVTNRPSTSTKPPSAAATTKAAEPRKRARESKEEGECSSSSSGSSGSDSDSSSDSDSDSGSDSDSSVDEPLLKKKKTSDASKATTKASSSKPATGFAKRTPAAATAPAATNKPK